MFSKKMESAGYTGGTNIFSLCCGFPARARNGRKNSDELGSPKDFTDENGENDDDEKDGGGGNYDGGGGGPDDGEVADYELTYDEISDNNEKPVKNGGSPADEIAVNDNDEKPESQRSESEKPDNKKPDGEKPDTEKPDEIVNEGNSEKESLISTSKVVDKENVREGMSDNESSKSKSKKEKKKKNGAAYQYDEESSSDSDDEVMKHYKETLVRSASMRSAKSGRSGRSKRVEQIIDGKSSRGSLNRINDPLAAAELGEVNSRTSYNAESDEERHRSPQSPHNTTTATPTSDSPSRGQGQTFENRAFLGDGQPSISGSDLAQSTEQLNSDEHLFDVSDLQNEPPLISKCGSLEVSFRYDNPNSRMVVVIHGARDIPSKERGGASSTQVRVMLLPGKKQRHKSKIKMGDSPVFGEKIYFNKILPDEVPNMGLRFRLYGLERMRRERMIGESIVGFASLNLDQETTHWVVLEPRSNLTGDSGFDVSSLSRSDSASSTQSLQHGGMPELLLGLSYNGTTGRLSVEAIKGSNFRNMAMNRPPDTYVKLSLMNSLGQEVQHCKTSVRRGQPNPLFKETFMLQVALFQLPEVTLMVSVYNKKSMKKKEMIGWFSLGMNSSGEEEAAHWLDMRESKGEQVCRWHVLLES